MLTTNIDIDQICKTPLRELHRFFHIFFLYQLYVMNSSLFQRNVSSIKIQIVVSVSSRRIFLCFLNFKIFEQEKKKKIKKIIEK